MGVLAQRREDREMLEILKAGLEQLQQQMEASMYSEVDMQHRYGGFGTHDSCSYEVPYGTTYSIEVPRLEIIEKVVYVELPKVVYRERPIEIDPATIGLAPTVLNSGGVIERLIVQAGGRT